MAEKAYKVFGPDWKCRGFQYKVGETYKHDGSIEMCGAGFHACIRVQDCFSYYDFNPANKVAIVLLMGDVEHCEDKSVCSEIHIQQELSWEEMLSIANTGCGCSGHSNSGDRNSGNRNSGHSNSGFSNSGDSNSGDSNSGDSNSGFSNSGDWNSGYSNSGNRNSGDSNSGNWNSGDWNSGFLNSNEPTMRMFNKDTGLKRSQIIFPNCFFFDLTVWVCEENMTKQEKDDYPECATLGGYLKTIGYKEAWANALKDISKKERQQILDLPNYDPDIFEEITGVRIEEKTA